MFKNNKFMLIIMSIVIIVLITRLFVIFINKPLEPIEPLNDDYVIARIDTKKLKVTIEETEKMYLTRVWVVDPYEQINKAVVEKLGEKLEYPLDIIEKEIQEKNLKDKAMLIINGSGFYKIGTWDPTTESYNEKYNLTSEGGLVITNNEVVRNWYYDEASDTVRNNSLYAINKKGKLVGYSNLALLKEEERQKLFNQIINEKYKNTWVFQPVIMLDGKLVNDDEMGNFLDLPNKRQILCQINKNNFAIISTKEKYTVEQVKEYVPTLNCETAVNLDGGGSISLLYKDKDNNIKVIAGNTREIVDVMYFVE